MEELREQGYSSIADIKYAVLENSGQLSVLPWARQQPPTAEQLGVDVRDETTLPVVLINDGRVLRKNLAACRRDEAWLTETLQRKGFASPKEVFLLTQDDQGQIVCIKKEETA